MALDKKYISIQYLRGVAVLLVVHRHLFSGLGSFALDLFFVISGFIMMDIILTKKRTAKEFFLARLKRVVPLYYLFTFVIILLGFGYEPSLNHIISSLMFLKVGWVLPVFKIGWTLDFEFSFYFGCAASLLLFKSSKHQCLFICSYCIIMFGLVNALTGHSRYFGYFLEFMFGVILFYVFSVLKSNISVWQAYVGLLIGVLLMVAGDLYYQIESIYQFRFIAFGLPSVLILLSLLLIEYNKKLISCYPLYFIGEASYSIYLGHYALFIFYRDKLRNLLDERVLSDCVFFIVAIALGCLCYQYIEKPLNRLVARAI